MRYTDNMAIDTLNNLIISKEQELAKIPSFLEDERNEIQMEINLYKRHLKKIVGC